MNSSGVMSPHDEYYLMVDRQRWACRPGDVIGRAGSIALDCLRPVTVLSRRHLMVEIRDGKWCLTALPEARNETFLNGLTMQRGTAYPLAGLQYLQVDSFHFQLGQEAHLPAITENDSTLSNEIHAPHGIAFSQLPVPMLETDLRLNILNASVPALALLGPHAIGHDLDEWAPDRINLRNCLLSLQDGGNSGPLVVVLQLTAGPANLELQGSRTEDRILIHLRDLSHQNKKRAEHEHLSHRFSGQSALLAELSLSRAFQEGDVAKSLTLLAHRASSALGCRRVSAWLKPEASNQRSGKIICQVCHDTLSPAALGTGMDLVYCPIFFDALATDEPWAIALRNTPVLLMLQQIAFAHAETDALLCVALQHADAFHGVLCFEKTGPDSSWSGLDCQFALCLASFGVLALQARDRREAMLQLQSSKSRMTAELEQANQYIQRVLPGPITSGAITAEWHMQPSEALGGDSFGYHWVNDLFVMYVLDVVGHGTGMALLSISVLNNVRARLLLGEAAMADPAGVLMDLNAAFPMENQNNMLFSMWYGVFDRRSRQLTFSSAGHPPAILLWGTPPEEDPDFATLGMEAPAVGAMEGMVYTNGHAIVDQGAKLFIFTDGAFEIPLGPEREWTFDEFTAVVRTTRYMDGGESHYLRKRISALCSSASLPDDFTIVRFTFEE